MNSEVPAPVEPDRTVRVVLVDDQPLLREGIATILQAQPDLDVVGQASTGAEALEVVARTRPDVVCMDVEMPGMSGLEATRRIVAGQPDGPRVLVLTTFNREDYLLEALRAGASAFLLKTARPEQLADAIRSVAAGDALLSPEVTRSIIERAVAAGDLVPRTTTQPAPVTPPDVGPHGASDDVGPPLGNDDDGARKDASGHRQRGTRPRSDGGGRSAGAEPARSADTDGALPPAAAGLTERERDVLALVARGMSNSEIAAELVIGRATVKTHVSNVLMKLDLRDRVQAVAYAYQHGLTN